MNVYKTGYNTSGTVIKKRGEEGQANQALTLFAPVSMAEDLTKVQLILCNDIKAGLTALKDSIVDLPFSDLYKKISETASSLEKRMTGLEESYKELKDIIQKRTTQHFSLDPSLLETWNPKEMVLKYSPWTNMRLMLNKVAVDNISDLFSTDWHPRPSPSTVQEKHFTALTEVMTEMLSNVDS